MNETALTVSNIFPPKHCINRARENSLLQLESNYQRSIHQTVCIRCDHGFLSAAFCTAGVQRRDNAARKRRRRSIPSCVNQLRSKTVRIKQQNVVFVISSTATSVVTNRCYKMIKLWLNYKLSSKALCNLHPIHTAAAVRRRASCWPDRRD